jgi:hyperosmotically inducible protein
MKLVVRPLAVALISAVGCVYLPVALGAAPQDQQSPRDTTSVNKTDRAPGAQTADQQSNRRSDLDVTRQIRRAIVNDKSLSTYAHNIKVITQHGQVTLKGPVRTEDEKRAVEAKAAEVAGAANVTNQVSVVPRRTNTSISNIPTRQP